MSSLFPNYSQGENRVTHAMLAVFERIDGRLLERILSAVTGESISLLTFRNQPRLPGGRQPDALITAGVHWYFEVKRVEGTLVGNEELKLRDYLTALDEQPGDGRVIAITPDAFKPAVIDAIGDPRLAWISFADLHSAIDGLITPPEDAEIEVKLLAEEVGDRDRFLLRELQALFVDDELLGGPDVVVVAARNAYPQYHTISAYVCQPASQRSFQPQVERMGFYANGAIQPEVPVILDRRGEVEVSVESIARLRTTGDDLDRRYADTIERYMATDPYAKNAPFPAQIFLLAPPTDPATTLFPEPIKNTTKASTGRGYAWTLGQRYTRSDALRKAPATTDDLTRFGG